ncbi:MAG: prepilin peptidase [Bryobacteraceae bacterium]|nr:prepilin peptidase [Bryobacteraceae bacterium]MDW8376611.1 prepilin peptidase [Bryobacterales bacterium]
MSPLPVPLQLLLLTLALIAAIWDVVTRRIPNWLVLAGLAAALMLQTWIQGWAGLGQAAMGFGLGFLVFFPIFLLQGKGGGDVKLMAAIGAITGPKNVFLIFLLTAILGGVMAVGLLLLRGGWRRTFSNIAHIVGSLCRWQLPSQQRPELSLDHPASVKLPYAVPIAAGSFLFLLLSRSG